MHKIVQLFLICGLISLASLLSASPAPFAHCDNPGSSLATDDETRQALQALTQPPSPRRTALLESYLALPLKASSGARQVALSHARVVLAAEHLRAGRHESARQVLAQVDLASPVAVDAALLLAESYRLQGNDTQAQAWLMRVAQRYSSDPEALSGLLLSARDMSNAGKVREAWALYSLINDKVLRNVEQVSGMRDMQSELVDELLQTRLDESRSVTSQVIKSILHSPGHEALSSMRQILAARRQLECLTREEESLKDEAWDESIQHANVTSFQTMLETEARINGHQLAALEKELQNAPERDRPAIEDEIAALKEQMDSLSLRLSDLKSKQEALPADSLSHQKKLEQRIAATQETVEQNKAAIRQELDKALAALQARYRELAAETQLARAELMQLLVSSR